MPKPVCVPCERFYRAEKNGFTITEGMPRENHVQPGKENDHLWEDYKIWRGDKWRCPGCGHEIVVGWGAEPISEHYQPDFQQMKDHFQPSFRVNDC